MAGQETGQTKGGSSQWMDGGSPFRPEGQDAERLVGEARLQRQSSQKKAGKEGGGDGMEKA